MILIGDVRVGEAMAAYGACQAACAAGVVTCYASAGLVFGTVTAGVGAPAAALTCNSIFGKCSAVCATKFLAVDAVTGITGIAGISAALWKLWPFGTSSP